MAEHSIGSVSVEVVPNARAFWVRFQEQTRGDAGEAGERQGNEFRRRFEGSASPARVRVEADTARARAELQAFSQQGARSSKGLLDALIPLAPALIPVAGAAGAAGGALAGMGIAGVLAVKGVQEAVKQGTPAGKQFSASINEANTALAVLEKTASGGVLSGFQSSVAKLSAELPGFNGFIGDSSTKLGEIGSHLAGALVSGFKTFAPVISEVETEFVRLAAAFERFASGPAGAKFAQTLADDFKQVVPVIESLALTATHLVAAFAPVGGIMLHSIEALSQAINAIPVPVLTGLATAFIGLRTAGAVSGGIAALSGSLGGLARVAGPVAGIAVGLVTAANATRDWQTSSNGLKATIGATLSLLTSAPWHDFSNAEAIHNQVDALARLRHDFAALPKSAADAAKAFAAQSNIGSQYPGGLPSGVQEGILRNVQTSLGRLRTEYQDYIGKVSQLTVHGAASALKQSAQTGLSSAVGNLTTYNTALQKSIDAEGKWTKYSKENAVTVQAGNRQITVSQQAAANALQQANGDYSAAAGLLLGHVDALAKDKAALAASLAGTLRVNEAVSNASAIYGITSAQLDRYAAATGVSADQLYRGTTTVGQFLDAVGQVKKSLDVAGVATNNFVGAIQAFDSAGDTAASRAALIGQALVSLQGDALGYANSMVSAATANQQLITDFRNTTKGVIDLKTGFIDYHNAGAAPVLNDLQQLQTAAMGAATATYQHEVATLGSSQAAKDAAAVFRNDTYGALVQQADQLGITDKQAKTLSDRYFHWPKNAKTLIAQLGGETVNSVLHKILDALIAISKGTAFDVTADTSAAEARLAHLRRSLASVSGVAGVNGVGLVTATGGSGAAAGHFAAGSGPGGVPDGYFTVGERGWELGRKRGSKVEIVSHTEAMKLTGLPDRLPGFANGTGERGGFTGVITKGSGGAGTGGGASSSSTGSSSGSATVKIDYLVEGKHYASLHAAENAALSAYKANIHLAATIEGKGFTSWRKALAGSVADARAAFATIRTDAKKLGVSDTFIASLNGIEKKTEQFVRDRNKVQAALGDPPNTATTAYDRLSDVLSKFRDERSSVADAVKGSFDITSAGANPVSGQITGDGLLAQSKQNRNLVHKFVADAKKLKGLINDTYWAQLVGDGPAALPQIDALLSLSKADRNAIDANQKAVAGAGVSLGTTAANQLYGSQLSGARVDVQNLKNRLHTDNTHIGNKVDQMRKELSEKLDHFAERPVLVLADGKTIARVVDKAHNEQAARK
jgi:hypothetical protein